MSSDTAAPRVDGLRQREAVGRKGADHRSDGENANKTLLSKAVDGGSGSGTPYSTSAGSGASDRSPASSGSGSGSGSGDADESGFFLDESGTGLSAAAALTPNTPPELRSARVQRAGDGSAPSPRGKPLKLLTPEDRALFERLEREWVEEDRRAAAQTGTWYSAMLWLPLLLVLRAVNVTMSVVFWPLATFARIVLGKQMRYVPFWDVPLERRKQTAVMVYFVMLIPLTITSYLWSIVLLLFPLTTLPMLSYYLWIFFRDKSPYSGSRTPFMRYWGLWRHFVNYFPLRLIKTANLDPEGRYVFGYHPHGILSMGAFGSFATDAAGFSRKFPGVDVRLLTLDQNFRCPLMREFLLSMGICSASRKACDKILQRGPGSAIMLVVGGAAESLDTEPGTLRLTLQRQGFVRVALDNGADLVPVLAFGENDLYDTRFYDEHTWVRKLQESIRDKLGFATPIFTGRGVFQYSLGILPHRKPVIVVVGKPIALPRLPAHLRGKALFEADGRKLVDHYHAKYKAGLQDLWTTYKDRWAVDRQGSLIIRK